MGLFKTIAGRIPLTIWLKIELKNLNLRKI